MRVLKATGQRYLEELDSLSRAGRVDMPIGAWDVDALCTHGAILPDGALRRWRFAQMQTAWGRSHACRVALTERGVILASATRYLLSGILSGEPISVCALGDLTPAADASPEFTRTLVEDVIADAFNRLGAGVALLFCRGMEPWHREAGYQDITPPDVELAFPPTLRPGAPMVSLRTGETRDLPAIVAMDRIGSAAVRFHLDRDIDFMTHSIVGARLLAGLGPAGMQELQFFVTEEGTIATAYVVMRVRGAAWTILECGDRDPSSARIGAIIQALIARDPGMSPTVRGWFPTGFTPPQATRVSVTPSSRSVLGCLLGSHRNAVPLTAETSLYWISDRF